MLSMSIRRPEATPFTWWQRWFAATQAVSAGEAVRIALTAGIAIGLTGFFSSRFLDGNGLQILLASMGASTVILFCVPSSPMARTWPLLGGHLISGAIGLGCSALPLDPWSQAALAVGVAILVMQLLRCLHPPGGASALVAVLSSGQGLGWQFLLTPLALNVAILFALHRLLSLRWPARAPLPPTQARATDDRPPLKRLGIRRSDLRLALREINSFVDVNESQLEEIYELAAVAALQRELGAMTCGDIMSRSLVTVEFATELDATWSLMRSHGVKAIPVVDRARHVLGIVTLTDFFRHAGVDRVDGLRDKLRRLLRTTPECTSAKPEVTGQVMSSPVVALAADAGVAEAALLLSTRGIHQIVVTDERAKLAGLISQTDLIAALYKSLRARSFADPDPTQAGAP